MPHVEIEPAAVAQEIRHCPAALRSRGNDDRARPRSPVGKENPSSAPATLPRPPALRHETAVLRFDADDAIHCSKRWARSPRQQAAIEAAVTKPPSPRGSLVSLEKNSQTPPHERLPPPESRRQGRRRRLFRTHARQDSRARRGPAPARVSTQPRQGIRRQLPQLPARELRRTRRTHSPGRERRRNPAVVLRPRRPTTVPGRSHRLERIHAQTRLERRGGRVPHPPQKGSRHGRSLRNSHHVRVHRRGRRALPAGRARGGTAKP